MARPDWFSDLQGLRYDWQCADVDKAEAARENFEQALLAKAREYQCGVEELKQVLRRDFAAWIKQEGLPRVRRAE